ncbi:hypothetical protein Hanom_Chr13g01223601 [Helianthus anomalus]
MEGIVIRLYIWNFIDFVLALTTKREQDQIRKQWVPSTTSS